MLDREALNRVLNRTILTQKRLLVSDIDIRGLEFEKRSDYRSLAVLVASELRDRAQLHLRILFLGRLLFGGREDRFLLLALLLRVLL